MKTFKFLALSLLVATAGLYSSMNIAEASEDKYNFEQNNNSYGIFSDNESEDDFGNEQSLAKEVTINYRTYSNNDEGILQFLDTNAYATVQEAANNFNRPVDEIRKLWAYNSTHKLKDIIKAVYQVAYEANRYGIFADNIELILNATRDKAKENGYSKYNNISEGIVNQILKKLCF